MIFLDVGIWRGLDMPVCPTAQPTREKIALPALSPLVLGARSR